MYLIDTSVWIGYFRQEETKAVKFFEQLLEADIPFGLTEVIYQEILQGASSAKDFTQLKDFLSSQRFFYPLDDLASYEQAAKIYYDCRKKGVTIRSTIDCLIAEIAIENNLTLVHHDKDFTAIAKVYPTLKLF